MRRLRRYRAPKTAHPTLHFPLSSTNEPISRAGVGAGCIAYAEVKATNKAAAAGVMSAKSPPSIIPASLALFSSRLSSRSAHTRRAHEARLVNAVGLYITSADWFTASALFVNSAVTFARAPSDAFASFRALDVGRLLATPFAGAFVALAFSAEPRAKALNTPT